MASVYSTGGRRYDYSLCLDPEGTYHRVVRGEDGSERVDQGKWHHAEGEGILRLESETPDDADRISNRWWVLSVKTCEDSNCVMVLRRAALASRNLPVLFYRVHLPDRRHSERPGIRG
jgi:hypothetical protein